MSRSVTRKLLISFSALLISLAAFAQAPVVASVSSLTPTPGSSVTIAGSSFNAIFSNNVVYFGSAKATVTGGSSTSLTVTVPDGLSYGPVSVTNTANNLTGYGAEMVNPDFAQNKSFVTASDFAAKVDFSSAARTTSLAYGDLDLDGKTDLVVTNKNNNTVTLYKNTATNGSITTGSYTSIGTLTTGNNPISVRIADVDGDGKLDIITADSLTASTAAVSILLNASTGTGNFNFSAKTDVSTSEGTILDVIATDINADGKTDIIVPFWGSAGASSKVAVFLSTGSVGSLSFNAEQSFTTGTGPSSVQVVDMNADGKPDVIVSNYGSATGNGSTVSVLRNTAATGGVASFATKQDVTVGTGPMNVFVADLNRDGKPEIITANYGNAGAGTTISVLPNNTVAAATSFTFASAVSISTGSGSGPRAIAVRDMTGDNTPDIVIANEKSQTVSVIINQMAASATITTGGFATKVDFATGGRAMDIAIVDVDGDGKPDIATANGNDNSFSILRNTLVPAPIVTDISPDNAETGATVTITGINFNTDYTKHVVYFGAVKAVVTGGNITTLTVTVPGNALMDKVTVIDIQSQLSGQSSTVFRPVFSPNKNWFFARDLDPKVEVTANNSPNANSVGPFTANNVVMGDLDGDGKNDVLTTSQNHVVGSSSGFAEYVVLRNNYTSGVLSPTSLVPAYIFSSPNTSFQHTGTKLADLNGDGKLDIIVGHNNTNNFPFVSIYFNTSSGPGNFSFGARQTITLSVSQAVGIDIADMNSDGKLDIIMNFDDVNNSGPAKVTVLFNQTATGSSTFSFIASDNISMGAGIRNKAVVVRDFDGDGKPDIATSLGYVNFTASAVARNTTAPGSTTLTLATGAALTQSSVGAGPGKSYNSMDAADFDGDGKQDLVMSVPGGIDLFRNTSTSGTISFAARVTISIASLSNPTVSTGDMNGDGRPDIVITDDGTSKVSVIANQTTGTGSFTAANFGSPVDFSTKIGATSTTPSDVMVGDITGDGKPDIIVGNATVNTITLFRNISDGANWPPVVTSVSALNPQAGNTVTITGNYFNSTPANNIVYFGAVKGTVTGGGTTSLTVTFPSGALYGPVSVTNTVNNLTAYGTELVNPTFAGKSTFTSGDLAAKVDFNSSARVSSVAYGDFDGDGKPDLVVANKTANQVTVYKNTSTQGSITTGSFTSMGAFATGNNPMGIRIADIDGDGKLDILTGDSLTASTGAVSILRNTSSGVGNFNFATKLDINTSVGSIFDVAVQDMNGDGLPDLVVPLWGNIGNATKVALFNNTGTVGSPSFGTEQSFTTGTGPAYVEIADFNADGNPDIVVANFFQSSGTTVSLFRNTTSTASTTFSFAAKQDLTTGTGPLVPFIADLNLDGKPDIVTANFGAATTTVSVLQNTTAAAATTFAFNAKVDLTVGTSPRSIAVRDMNGDGKPDIVTVNNTSLNVSVLINQVVAAATITSGGFTKTDFATGNRVMDIALEDVDGDGMPDITTANGNDNTFSILRNQLLVAPTTQATNIVVTNLTGISATLSWTNGSGSKRAVFMKATTTGSPAPVDLTYYAPNAQFGSGTQISSSGWFSVFTGTGSTVNVTGLTGGTTYRVKVVEYNDNDQNNLATYLTSDATDNPVNVTAVASVTALSRAGTAITNAASVQYNFTANAPLTGLSASNFSLTTGGTLAGVVITAVNGAGGTYSVTVNTGTGDGNLILNLANITGLTPSISNVLPYVGDTYTIDKTAPTLNPVTIASNNSNPSAAKTGDVITLSFTSNETIQTPTVTIAGQTAVVSNLGGNNWQATYTMQGSDAAGNIPFNISFSDLAGNAGTAVTAVTGGGGVVFYPSAAVATLTTVTIASNNANTSLAKVGDIVTLNITASGTLANLTATIAGQTAAVTKTGGNNWRATYTMTSGETAGVVPFTINFADPAGNTGTQVTATTNSSSVTFDKTAPVLAPVTIASNNSNTTLAKPGDVVTLSITADGTLGALTVTIAGRAATVNNTSGNDWTASVTMNSGDANGVIPFTINYRDASGNAGTQVTATSNASSVTFNKTLPVLTPVSIVSNNPNPALARQNDIVTLTFTSSKTINAPVVVIAGHTVTATPSGNNWTATYQLVMGDPEGNVAYSISSYADANGNAGATVTGSTDGTGVFYSNTPPNLAPVNLASNNANPLFAVTGNTVTLTFTASEPILQPTVTIAGHSVTASSSNQVDWTATYVMAGGDAEGNVPFSIAYTNLASDPGNPNPVVTTTNGSSVTFDITPPSLSPVTIVSNNSNPAAAKTGDVITLSFTSNEKIQSPTVTILGQAATISNNSNDKQTWTATYTVQSGDAGGTVPFNIIFSDLAGNAGTAVSTTTNSSSITNYPPGFVPSLSPVTIASNNSNPAFAKTGHAIRVTLTANAPILTPTILIAGQAASVINITGNTWQGAYTTTGSEAEGVVLFQIEYADGGGNPGTTVTATTNASSVTFDKTAPTLNPVTIASNNANPSAAKTGDVITLSFTSNEAIAAPTATIAGNTAVVSNLGGNNWKAVYTMQSGDAAGNVPFNISFADLAGNAGTAVSVVTSGTGITYYPSASVATLSAVTIASNNANTALAKTGNTVTIDITASGTLAAVSTTIAGHTATTIHTTGNNWQATYIMTGSDAEGIVPFTIDYADPAGNTGTQVTATTNSSNVTFDRTAPTLNPVTISSNNSNPSAAKTGDVITVQFTSSETVSTPAVTIAGNAATVSNNGGNNWQATYTLQSGDAAGNIPFNISFTDLAGNAGTAVTSVTTGTGVVFYPTASVATLSSVTIASNNANSSRAKTGNTVTLTITASGTLGILTSTIAGNAATVTNTGGNNWRATYIMSGSDAEGVIPFTINYADPAGNTGTLVTTTSNSSSVIFDRTVPTLNPVTLVSNNANPATAKTGDVVTLDFTASEDLITPTVMIAGHTVSVSSLGGTNWRATYTLIDADNAGSIAFSISYSDLSGNAGVTQSTVTSGTGVNFYPSGSAATLSTVSIASNNTNTALAKTGDLVTLSISASGALQALTVTIAGHAATLNNTGGNNWTAPYTMAISDNEGVVPFTIDYADPAGNAPGHTTATTNSSSVNFDRTAPTLSPVTIASNNTDATASKPGDVITLDFTSSESIQTPTVTIAGHTVSATNTGGNNWRATYTMIGSDADGTIAFNVSYADLAGNAGAAVTTVTSGSNITNHSGNSIPALGTISIVSNNTNTTKAKTGDVITLNITAAGTIKNLSVSISNHTATVSNTGGNNWRATYTMTVGDAEGIILFAIDYTDAAGNAATQKTTTTDASAVIFDRSAPTLNPVTIGSNNADATQSKPGDIITLHFTSSEPLQTPVVTIAGQTVTVVNTGGNNWTATYTVQPGDADGTIPFNISYSDLAGNAGSAVTSVTAGGNISNHSGGSVPSLGTISIASSNSNTTKAKTGDVITLNITAAGTIKNVSVTISAHTASVVNTGGNNWTATYTMTGSDAEGIISFAIDYTDAAGNAATQKTATTDASAVIFDRSAPALNPVTIGSNNADPTQSKPGDIITLSFTSSEPLQTPVVTIAGQTVTVINTGGNNWTATYTVQPGDADGTIPFNINYADLAGNAGSAVTSVTTGGTISNHSGSSIPTLGTISIASNNTNTSRAKIGDVITLNITASGTIKNVSVTIAGHTVTAVNTSGNNWRTTYTMTVSDAEGLVRFAIDYTDAAGNAATQKTATTNASSVIFDRTAPTLNPVTISSNNTDPSQSKPGDLITLSFRSNEPLQTPSVTIAGHTVTAINTGGNNWTATYTVQASDADGAIPFNINFADLAGNAGTAVTSITTGSNISNHSGSAVPALGTISIASNNANTAQAKVGDLITLSITAAGTIKNVSVTVAAHTATVVNAGGNNWRATYTMTGSDAEGIIPFAIDYTDDAGNAATQKTATTDASSVNFDRSAPTLNPVTIGSSNPDPTKSKPGDIITLTFTASEPLQTPTVTIAGQTATLTSTDGIHWTATYTVQPGDADGTIPFNISYSDPAGNAGTAVTSVTTGGSITNYAGNSIPALGSVTIASNNANSSKAKVGDVVTLNIVSAGAIKNLSVTISGHTASVVNTSGNNWKANYTMTGSDAEGTVLFAIDYTDPGGNAGTQKTTTTDASSVDFDRTSPTLTSVTMLSSNADPSVSKPGDIITLNFTASEILGTPTVSIAGHTVTASSSDGIHWTATYTIQTGDTDGTLPFNIAYADLAGNAGVAATSVTSGTGVTNYAGSSVPALGTISIASNNANAAKAKTGDVIMLNITAAGTIKGVSVTIAGHTAAVVNTGGNNWTATYTMGGSDAEGVIAFAIDYTDQGGNAGAQKTTTTNSSSVVFDRTAPSLSPVTLSSNNANPSLARTGNMVRLNFTASESISVPSVAIAGHSVIASNTGGNNWTASYTMQESDANGTITFNIAAGYTDGSGNTGAAVNSATDASGVLFSNSAVFLTPVTITSNNTNTSFAKPGDAVTVSFTASEAINAPVVTIAGHTVTAVNTSGNNWTAVYTMSSADAEGIVTFRIEYSNLFGTAGTPVTATTNNSNVNFYKTAPALGSVTIASNNADPAKAKTGDAVILSFAVNRASSSPVVMIAGHSVTANNTSGNNWTATYTMGSADAEGTVAFSIAFSDKAGNAGTTVTATTDGSNVIFDRTAPTLNPVTIQSNNADPSVSKPGDIITLNFTASEPLATPTVIVGGQPVAVTSNDGIHWTATYTVRAADADGVLPFNISYADLAGNAGTAITSVTTGTGVSNHSGNAVPGLSSVTIASNNTANPSYATVGHVITVSFTADAAIRSVAAAIAGKTAAIANTSGNNWKATYTMTSADAQGDVAFSISYTDAAGNAATAIIATTNNSHVNFDKTAPQLTAVEISSSNGDPVRAKVGDVITLNFESDSPILTPTVTIAGKQCTVTNLGGNKWKAVYSMTVTDLDGNVPFEIDFKDVAGNAGSDVVSTTNSSSVLFDKIVPQLSPVSLSSGNPNPSRARSGDVITLLFTASEAVSAPYITIAGHPVTAVNTSSNNWKATYTMTVNDPDGVVNFVISNYADAASNEGPVVKTTTNSSGVLFSNSDPVLTPLTFISNNTNASYAKVGDVVTLSFTASEAINTPTVTIASHAVTAVNTSGNNWTASYTMTASDAEGTVPFSVDYSNLFNTSGPTAIITTNNGTVTFFKTAPVLSPVTIASNNPDATRAKPGDVVTVNFSGNRGIIVSGVTIAGKTATVSNTGGNNRAAVYTMMAGDPSGLVAFQINYTDLAGNAGTAVIATTNGSSVFFDNAAPSLNSVTILSDNRNTILAKPGDAVTVNFTTDQTIQTPVVSIAGSAASVRNTGGNNWAATRSMNNSDAEGVVAFTIAYTDLAGNTGTAISTTTDNSRVVFDRTAPVLNPVSLSSSNSNPSLARTGDVLTLRFTSNESISIPVVTIKGHTATVVNTGGNNWKADYTLTSADENGVVNFIISAGYTDAAGNAGAAVNSTTNGTGVLFSNSSPVLAPVRIVSNNTSISFAKPGDIVSLTFTSSQAIGTPVVTIAGHPVTVVNANGNNWAASYTMTAADAEGLVPFSIHYANLFGTAGETVTGTTDKSSVTFYKTSPALDPVSIGSNNATVSRAKPGDKVTVNFTGNRVLIITRVNIAGNTAAVTNTGGNNWQAVYTMTGSDAEGIIPFNIVYTDAAGNTANAVSTTTNNSSVLFDKTAPILNAVTISSNNADPTLAKTGDLVTLKFTANEALKTPVVTIAGIAATVINTGGNNWSAIRTMTANDAAGAIVFTIAYSDLAGNAGSPVNSTTNNSSVRFDKAGPVISLVSMVSDNANPTLARTGNIVTVNFRSNETITTPVVTIAGHTASLTNTGGNNWRATYSMVATDTEGKVAFKIAAGYKDAAGNSGVEVTRTTDGTGVLFSNSDPVLAPVTIVSNNAVNTSYAKPGDVVTLKVTGSQDILMPAVMIAGHTITPTQASNTNWTASYTMTDADAEGVVAFSVEYSNLFGTKGKTVTATTNSSSVTFYKTKPELNTVSIASDNINPSKAKVGDKVTVSFTGNRELAVSQVTIAGHAVTVSNTGGNNWIADYTMTSGDAEGLVAFRIAFTDLAGNEGTAVDTATDRSSVLFEKTIPTLGLVSIASDNADSSTAKPGDIVSLRFVTDKAIHSAVVTIAGNAAVLTNAGGNNRIAVYTMAATDAEGKVAFSISYRDSAGNEGITVTETTNATKVIFEKTAPSLNAISIASNNGNPSYAKAGDIVTLRFTAVKKIAVPGVTLAGHTVSATNTAGNNWQASYTMANSDAEGLVSFGIVYKDPAGNNGITDTLTTDGSHVFFDKAAPSLQSVHIASNNADTTKAKPGDIVTLRFVASEAIGKPVVTLAGHTAAITYAGNNTWIAAYTMQQTDTEGDVAFSISYVDLAGISGTTVTQTTDNSHVIFYKTIPELKNIHIGSNGADQSVAYPGDMVTVSFRSDVNGIAVTAVIAGQSITAVFNGNEWTASRVMTAADAAGIVSFSLIVTDPAGNTAAPVTATTDASKVDFRKQANSAPSFTRGASATLTLCANISAMDIGSLLQVNDADNGQALTWSVFASPVHATLTGFTATAVANGGTLTPTGLSYTPATGYSGTDEFKIKVSDGTKEDTITISVTVHGLPGGNISSSQGMVLCNAAAPIVLTAPSATAFTWFRDNVVIGSGAASLPVTQTGSYTVKIADANGCWSDTLTNVKITMGQPAVAAVRMAPVNIFQGQPAILNARTFGNSYQWTPATGLDNINISAPTATLQNDQEYKIQISTASGCITVDTLLARIYTEHMFLANVFSPNNDGKNDVFYPVLVGVKELKYFRIYNRTGKQLYETTKMNTGWDGTFNGQKMPFDTYVWQVLIITDKGESLYKQGMVTLLR